MTVGDRVKLRRKELGLTADELAKAIGKDRSTVYRYESHEIEDLPISIVKPLATALHTTPEYIMGWEEEDSTSQDDELQEYLEELKNREEMRMLFSLAKGATKEDVEQAVKIIEALRKD